MDLIHDQMCDQVRDQMRDEVRDQMRDQVYDQIRANWRNTKSVLQFFLYFVDI